ncbi:hypothetical protein NBRC116188_00450 [Oceaniserpentilla sp. 4NH20-0058]|uniref:hypothetical protein n=1 Tax=Oceaniserpentilla sp. 4NH20-0058 TaxID=3127660 RepID=UPI00310820B1
MEHVSSSAYKLFLISLSCMFINGCQTTESSDSSDKHSGVSGSSAQLILFDGAVYSLASNKLVRVDIDDVTQPVIDNEQRLGSFEAQTLTTDGEQLYLGSPGEVRIYDYADGQIRFIDSAVRDIPGDDPVITDGEYAYSTVITLESETEDGTKIGQGDLYVYEIDSANNITELAFYPRLGYLKGLALWDKTLMVCDPLDGLMQLDVTDPLTVSTVSTFADAPCNDLVHLGGGHFVTVGEEGIFQLMPDADGAFSVVSGFN